MAALSFLNMLQQRYYDYEVDTLVDQTTSKIAKYSNQLHDLFNDMLVVDQDPARTTRVDPNSLPEVLLAHVCSFLALEDIGSLAQTCKPLNHILDPLNADFSAMFYLQYWREFDCETHVAYLNERLAWQRNELMQFTTLLPLLQAVKLVSSVMEISGNLGMFPTRAIAQAVSRRRPQALGGVLIDDVAAATECRKRLKSYSRSVNFMITSPPESTLPTRPAIHAKGFVGYALDLLQLRECEEQYRESVLAALVYRDLTVWETYADMRQAIDRGEYRAAQPFFCIIRDERDSEVLQADIARTTMTCSWKRFRPQLSEIKSPHRYCERLRSRVQALELARAKACSS